MTDDEWWTRAVEQFGLDNAPAGVAAEPRAEPAEAGPSDGELPTDDLLPAAVDREELRRHRRRTALSWIVVAVGALVGALLLRAFVVQQFAVDGDSMLSTLHSGDRVLVNKLSYHLHDPHRGDIVVLESLDGNVEVHDLIKRVVGVPGDTVEYRECRLYVNGQQVDEPYLDATLVGPGRCGESQRPVQIEPGHVFVMGDNRASSLDSRTAAVGQIPFDHLIGRAFIIVWPFSDLDWL
jgi:signal peptidase I